MIETISRGPVPSASVNAFIATAESASDGNFTLIATSAPASSQAVTVTADGYRPRETVIRWPRAEGLVIDIASTAKPFDETFFTQLARDGLDNPTKDYALYRWSSQMKFYVKTQDEFGRPLDSGEIGTIRRGIEVGVQYFTAGSYQAIIEEGTETRPEQTGWINVVPLQVIPEGNFCGWSSTVGGNPMTIKLRIDTCGCGSIKIPMDIVMHEVGHAVGMFHVSGKDNIMTPGSYSYCRDTLPTAIEQYHARLIYARPRGNHSPDRDPGDFSLGQFGPDQERPSARP